MPQRNAVDVEKSTPPEFTVGGARMKSILVVDDEAGIRSFLKRGLEKQYGLVEVVENAAAAEEIRQRCYFDLIISDIRLPGKSGVDWITELRQRGQWQSVDLHYGKISLCTLSDFVAATTDLLRQDPWCFVTNKPEVKE